MEHGPFCLNVVTIYEHVIINYDKP